MVFGLFKSKKEKAVRRALDTTKDNLSRIRALDYLEERSIDGDDESLDIIFRCFQITVKPDKQEKTLTPYDDEQEKWSLIDRLVGMGDQRTTVLKKLRKELATPPLLPPGRRDGIVWLIELLRSMAKSATDDADEADEMVLDEIIRALVEFDPEETYREASRKLELIRALGRHKGKKSTTAIIPFLLDVDESVRHRAVESLAIAGEASAGETLCTVVLEDESLRVRQRAAEVLADINASIKGHPNRKKIEELLPKDVMVDRSGTVKRRAS